MDTINRGLAEGTVEWFWNKACKLCPDNPESAMKKLIENELRRLSKSNRKKKSDSKKPNVKYHGYKDVYCTDTLMGAGE